MKKDRFIKGLEKKLSWGCISLIKSIPLCLTLERFLFNSDSYLQMSVFIYLYLEVDILHASF